jgi:hypothetical protein
MVMGEIIILAIRLRIRYLTNLLGEGVLVVKI